MAGPRQEVRAAASRPIEWPKATRVGYGEGVPPYLGGVWRGGSASQKFFWNFSLEIVRFQSPIATARSDRSI